MSKLPQRLAPISPAQRALESHHRHSKAVVSERVRRNGGFCEGGCGRNGADVILEWAHIFGRGGSGACLGEPWASDPTLCAGLERHCHEAIDGKIGGTDLKLRNKLRRRAVEWFAEEHHVPVGQFSDPVAAIRRLVELVKSLRGS